MNSKSTHSLVLIRQQGFTLLEMLLVVVIIGIMSVLGVNLVNSQSIERVVLNQAQQVEASLKLLCEQSVFENQAQGLEVLTTGLQVLRYQQPIWQARDFQVPGAWESQVELYIDGLSQQLLPEATDEPHIICQTDGSFSQFTLHFFADPATPEVYYVLETAGPWELTGGWHHP